MNLGAEDEFYAGQIARAEVELLVELAAALDQEGGLAGLELVERGAEELGLGLGDLEGLDDGDLAVSDLRGDGRAERAHQLLLREGVLVAARLGSVNRTASTPERSANGPDASAAGSLLLPELLAGTGDLIAALGGGGSLTKGSAIVLDRLPEQCIVDLACEDLVGEFELADLLPAEIDYIDVCHRSSLFAPAIDAAGLDFVRLRYPVFSPRSFTGNPKQKQRSLLILLYFFFGAAFFEAFNASIVAAPANPRRSRGGALALEMST